jgi:hypothetical protein
LTTEEMEEKEHLLEQVNNSLLIAN